MRVACCVDGEGTAALVQYAVTHVASIDRLDLLHCIDAGPQDEVRLVQGAILGRRHRGEGHDAQLGAAEEHHAVAVLAEAAAATRTAGYQRDQQTWVLHGRPGHEIVRALAAVDADVVVLYPRPPARQGPPGPHSLGHAARFIVDHAPCAVLLVRGR